MRMALIRIGGVIMADKKNMYIFEYLDENDFRKKERSVRKIQYVSL